MPITTTHVSGATEPIGRRIGHTVRRLRHNRGLDLRRLAERLAEEGRPISLAQLSKLELGQRRVDVDDLVALAVVLNVTPSQLLMPEPPREGDEQEVALTPHRGVGWHRAWQWMCGDYWLDDAMRPGKDEDDLQAEGDAEADWHFSARPHDPFGGYTFRPSFLFTREADVHAVVEAVKEALKPKEGKNTLTRQWLFAAIDWFVTVDTGQGEHRMGPARG
jgi:transcriptional regulator with XRE-family HTH domain